MKRYMTGDIIIFYGEYQIAVEVLILERKRWRISGHTVFIPL